MSNFKHSDFHIVYSPQDKGVLEDKKEVLRNYLDEKYDMWIMSDEVGKGQNPHLDIVGIQIKVPVKTGNESTRIKTILESKGRYELKCNHIDEGQLIWQIGYCLKEGIDFETSEIFDFDLEECKEMYEKNPEGVNGRKLKVYEKKWTLDTYADNLVKYYKEKKIFHGKINELEFRKINKKFIGASLLHKINGFKINEFCEMHEVFEDNSWANEKENILGMVTADEIRIKKNIEESKLV